MKPLTIEEVKALKAEDWVWVIDINSNLNGTYYISEIYLKIYRINDTEIVFYMQNYASTILRSFSNINANTFIYKNKEQAGNFADKLMECIETGGYDGWHISYDFLDNYELNCKPKNTEGNDSIEILETALDLCEQAYLLAVNGKQNEGISIQAMASDLGIHKFFLAEAGKRLAEHKKD